MPKKRDLAEAGAFDTALPPMLSEAKGLIMPGNVRRALGREQEPGLDPHLDG